MMRGESTRLFSQEPNAAVQSIILLVTYGLLEEVGQNGHDEALNIMDFKALLRMNIGSKLGQLLRSKTADQIHCLLLTLQSDSHETM